MAIHLSGLPGGGVRMDTGRAVRPPLQPCSGWGLPSRPGHPGRWCALTAPFHPCLCVARKATPSAVCSLWHFPAGRPDWPLASTLPSGVPTFLDPYPTGASPPTRTSRGHPAGSPSPLSSHRLPTCGPPGRRHPALGLACPRPRPQSRHRPGRVGHRVVLTWRRATWF